MSAYFVADIEIATRLGSIPTEAAVSGAIARYRDPF
jgi:hypothetical protein